MVCLALQFGAIDMKVKLVQNFHKAYSFIFAALTSIVAFFAWLFELVPADTFGEYGVLVTAIVAAIVALLRVLPQPKDGLE